jgi:antitoxin ParD1/3/4
MIGVARRTMMTVRRSGALGADANGGEGGACETVGASSREPIRRDEGRVAFERLKAQLQHAFAAPEESYRPLTATEVIARNG